MSPKRIVDGEAVWRSGKISRLQPQERAEYTWLLALALSNGSFEVEARLVWSRAYAYNRPDVTPEMVQQILDAFEREKLLFRWKAPDGRLWGYWVGIDKPGRLPSPARRGTNEVIGEEPPREELARFVMDTSRVHTDAACVHADSTRCLGLGLGFGLGIGKGESNSPSAARADGDEPRFVLPLKDGTQHSVTHERVAELKVAYPQLDVERALREMAEWLKASPTRRKSAAGIERFIVGWLNRQKSSPSRKSASALNEMDYNAFPADLVGAEEVPCT